MKLVTSADVKHSDVKCQMLKAQHHFFQEIHLLGQKKRDFVEHSAPFYTLKAPTPIK